MEKRIAVLNRERGPRGPLELRMSARFWSPKETITFSEFLDNVEGVAASCDSICPRDCSPQEDRCG
jgi:hypothetical protein